MNVALLILIRAGHAVSAAAVVHGSRELGFKFGPTIFVFYSMSIAFGRRFPEKWRD
jgi:hypothetical protein